MLYLDHAATTQPRPEAIDAMNRVIKNAWANPSSIHFEGQKALHELDRARETIAEIFGCRADEIIFTSGGTESDNLAIRGIAEAHGKGHIITSAVEHHAVLDTVHDLEKRGFSTTVLPVDEFGAVDPAAVEAAITPETILITIMYANNEVGTINPISKIGKIAEKQGIAFHTDAVQAAGALPLSVDRLKVSAMSISGHKFYGPKGVGALFLRRGVRVRAQQIGGGQERRRRSGTENVAAIAAMAEALRLAEIEREVETARLAKLRDEFFTLLEAKIPHTRRNGDPEKRLPNNVNMSFAMVEGESILLRLDMLGICASSGSACTSGTLDPSHVLLAMGVPVELAHGSIRFTMGKTTTRETIETVAAAMQKIIADLREISPIKSVEGLSCTRADFRA